jgi:hypothetical protein
MHYEIGGSREEHNIYKFKAGSFGFVEDCILNKNTGDGSLFDSFLVMI